MLTDACASCVPYCGGYAHWGMLKAARWFVDNELQRVREICDAHPGYGLLLCGHSLGAGTAVLLAHLIREGDEAAKELMQGIKLQVTGPAIARIAARAYAWYSCPLTDAWTRRKGKSRGQGETQVPHPWCCPHPGALLCCCRRRPWALPPPPC
jgi:hypothetical protein